MKRHNPLFSPGDLVKSKGQWDVCSTGYDPSGCEPDIELSVEDEEVGLIVDGPCNKHYLDCSQYKVLFKDKIVVFMNYNLSSIKNNTGKKNKKKP